MAYSSRVARLCRRASLLGVLMLGTCAAAPDQRAGHVAADLDGLRLDAAWVFEGTTRWPAEHWADHRAARLDGIRLDGAWTEERMARLPDDTLKDIAEYYARGRHVRRDEDLAEKLFSAAAGDHSIGLVMVGIFYQFTAKNDGKAIAWYEQSMAAGDYSAAALLALIYRNKKSEFYSPSKAIAFLKMAAAAGSKPAHALLGQFYLEGNGVAVDYAWARDLFLAAVDCGNAARSLGEIYLKGLGVKKDPAKAEGYFLRAARKGNSLDINRLADLYLSKAFPVKQQVVKAFAWYLVDAMINPGQGMSHAEHMYPYLNDRSAQESLRMAERIVRETEPEIYRFSNVIYYRERMKEKIEPMADGCTGPSPR